MAINLSTIASGPRLKPPKIVVYGVGGVGKTTFAAGAPNPIFLFTEEGQGALDVARFEPRDNDPVLRSWDELLQCLAALHSEQHDYQTVVLDSLDFAEPLLWAHVAAQHNVEGIEDFGYGKGYVHAAQEARNLTGWLDALRNDRNMAIVVICHCDTVKFDDPTSESYDVYDFRVHKRLSALFDYWSDAVLFANYETVVLKEKDGFKGERRRGVGRGERVLYTEKRPAFRAKNRYGLQPKIPLSWQAFQDGIVKIEDQPEPEPQPEAPRAGAKSKKD